MLSCPRCRGRLRLVALIHAPAVIARILHHVGVSAAVPVMRPARDPPGLDRGHDMLVVTG